MKIRGLISWGTLGVCVAAAVATLRPGLSAAPQAPPQGTSASMNGLLVSALTFVAADANKDGVVTREEWTATGRELFGAADAPGAGSITRDQLQPVLNEAMPLTGLAAVFNMGGGPQPTTPQAASVDRMMAALPARAPASPSRPRRVLVFARAAGFVHSSIPLAAKTVEALGAKTGAWTTTISYDAADITAENLKEYDALFLASTTGAFLDEPGNDTVTAARRQALLDFVRGGKGLAGIHAASDSYHMDKTPAAGGVDMAALLAGFSPGATLAPAMVAHGDSNGDDRLDRAEMDALLDGWFRMMDTTGSGQLLQSDVALLALLIPHPPADAAAPVPQGRDPQVGTWPDFNRMIGGFFKYHWLDPQKITVKIDDATSPLTAMFNGQSFDVHDEIYTMSADSWSRRNVRVLTSIDYEKMSPADRALEEYPRADHDHGISWIRREGDGRVFYLSLGHSERIYADRRILEHLLAGMQYVLGDLAADDAPSVR